MIIEIAGKKVSLHFGYLSYKTVMTSKNRNLLFDESGNPTDIGVAKIIYSGYQNDCMNKEIEADIPFDDFSRGVDLIASGENGVETLQAIIKEWSESNDIQKLIKDTEEKKSQIQPIETLTG